MAGQRDHDFSQAAQQIQLQGEDHTQCFNATMNLLSTNITTFLQGDQLDPHKPLHCLLD